jgi:hypothetical protein
MSLPIVSEDGYNIDINEYSQKSWDTSRSSSTETIIEPSALRGLVRYHP